MTCSKECVAVNSPIPKGGLERTSATNAIAGGCDGFSNPSPSDDSAWLVAIEGDPSEPVGDIAHLEHLLTNGKLAEAAMLYQTLGRLREALATSVTKGSLVDSPVMITAMDAVLLSRLLLRRLG